MAETHHGSRDDPRYMALRKGIEQLNRKQLAVLVESVESGDPIVVDGCNVVFVAVLFVPAFGAAQTGPPEFVLWSAAELAQRNAALAERIRPDGSARETLADYGSPGGSHRFRFIRRDADGVPEQHAHIEDVVFIQSGAGTLVVGGDMVDRAGGNGEYRGSDIAGGVHYPVGAGDVIHIPADTPHRYLVPDGGHVTYVLVRLPAFTGEPIARADAPVLDFEPPGFAMWSAAELDRRNAALATRIGPDRSSRETLADYGNPSGAHRFRFIHRDADGVPEIHDEIIDVVLIQSGAGELLVGGEMLDRDGSRGSGIAGGERHPVAAGDVLHIPARTPHGYLVPEGGHVTYVLVRTPAFVP